MLAARVSGRESAPSLVFWDAWLPRRGREAWYRGGGGERTLGAAVFRARGKVGWKDGLPASCCASSG